MASRAADWPWLSYPACPAPNVGSTTASANPDGGTTGRAVEPALETSHPPSERQLPADDRDGRRAASSAKGGGIRPPNAGRSKERSSARPSYSASNPEHEALIDDAIALFSPRYGRAISRE